MICLLVIALGGGVLSQTYGVDFVNDEVISLKNAIFVLALVVIIIIIVFGGCIIDLYMIEGRMKKEMKSTIRKISDLNIQTKTKCNV